MVKLKRMFARRTVAAIVVGVLLAGAPLVVFDLWIEAIIDRQVQNELSGSAKRAIGLAEVRVAQAITALDRLAADGVASCSPQHIQMMRQAVFATMPVKEMEILSPTGQTLCTHLDLPLGKSEILSSEPLPANGGYLLEIVRLDNGGRMVRLRRPIGGDGSSIAALLPVAQLMPQVSHQGTQFEAYGEVRTGGGNIIGYAGKRLPAGVATESVHYKSAQFGFNADIVAPLSGLMTTGSDLKWFGIYVAMAIAVVLGAFWLLLPRRRENDPVSDLKRALAAGELVPYYQPIVDIRSGQLRGAEVLVRWRKPDGSLVFPGSFIPLAESSGLIRDMTRDLMRRVCAEAGASLGLRPGLKISFNFAGKLFSDETIVKDVRNIFANSPIKLSQVVLEVTERDPIENFTETRQIIAALQGLGVRIAIDDVGTGHSGLSYMLKLGVDIIKIDKMFVDAIGTDRNSMTIVETLVDLAHNMRMDVVAEGVENFEQVTLLRELGIRSAQGYVFAPPLPGSAFLQLVEAIEPLETAEAAAAKEAA
ncbi:EAL domain-containing protein [Pseudolabrys taiwanensis]|uniref:EAL domain-containing protein n=2 Tax=Pseudolabrys taiwanensis TaxID=331696 RepID=A0A345ZU78_9HYPH|nr:EAL domain-containing protein [Pseudolabrys taiwanensis]